MMSSTIYGILLKPLRDYAHEKLSAREAALDSKDLAPEIRLDSAARKALDYLWSNGRYATLAPNVNSRYDKSTYGKYQRNHIPRYQDYDAPTDQSQHIFHQEGTKLRELCKGRSAALIEQNCDQSLNQIIAQLSQPGRLLVVTQELEVLLRPRWVKSGCYMFQIESTAATPVPFGVVHLAEFDAKRLSTSQSGESCITAACIALSVCEHSSIEELFFTPPEYGLGVKRLDADIKTELLFPEDKFKYRYEPYLRIMAISKEKNGCYRRIGLGRVEILPWVAAGPRLKPVILE